MIHSNFDVILIAIQSLAGTLRVFWEFQDLWLPRVLWLILQHCLFPHCLEFVCGLLSTVNVDPNSGSLFCFEFQVPRLRCCMVADRCQWWFGVYTKSDSWTGLFDRSSSAWKSDESSLSLQITRGFLYFPYLPQRLNPFCFQFLIRQWILSDLSLD